MVKHTRPCCHFLNSTLPACKITLKTLLGDVLIPNDCFYFTFFLLRIDLLLIMIVFKIYRFKLALENSNCQQQEGDYKYVVGMELVKKFDSSQVESALDSYSKSRYTHIFKLTLTFPESSLLLMKLK